MVKGVWVFSLFPLVLLGCIAFIVGQGLALGEMIEPFAYGIKFKVGKLPKNINNQDKKIFRHYF